MRTSTKKITSKAKRTALGVVVLLNITLGLQSVERELRIKNCSEMDEDEAIEIAKKRYTSIVHAGGKFKVTKIVDYQPPLIGVKSVFERLRMF